MEPTGFADGFYARQERKRGAKDDSKAFSLATGRMGAPTVMCRCEGDRNQEPSVGHAEFHILIKHPSRLRLRKCELYRILLFTVQRS